MMRLAQILFLRARDVLLSNQIANGRVLVVEHRAALIRAYRERRRVRNRLAVIESPRALIDHALRSGAHAR